MIPIVDICWQDFQPEEILKATVGELVDLAKKPDLQSPFVVVHTKQFHLSVLVFRDQVIQLVEALRLSPGDSALDTGLLDLLRQGQATVGANEPAGRVAWLATKYDIEVVIVVNDDGIPVGLFIPSIVTERLPQTMDKLQQSSPQLQYTIAHLTEENNLPGAIIALEGEHNQYRSERFSQLNIQAFLCEDHGDPAKYHHIFRPSCTKHPGAKVRKIP